MTDRQVQRLAELLRGCIQHGDDHRIDVEKTARNLLYAGIAPAEQQVTDEDANRVVLLEAMGRVASAVAYLRHLMEWAPQGRLDLIPPIPIPPILRELTAPSVPDKGSLPETEELAELIRLSCERHAFAIRGSYSKEPAHPMALAQSLHLIAAERASRQGKPTAQLDLGNGEG